MKSTTCYFMVVVMRMLAFLLAMSGELRAVAPEDIRPPEDLMYVFERPPLYGTKDERAVFFAEQKKRILEAPDITNRLYDFLWPSVEAGRFDLYQYVFYAFYVRGDLAPEKLQKITDQISEKATPDVAGTTSNDQIFVESAASLLGNYPSAAHEELLLSLLKMGDEGWSRAAAISLGKIGTRRSIEPLRQLVKTRAERVDPKMRDEMVARYGPLPAGDPVAAALSNLERRVDTSERKSSRDNRLDQQDLESKGGISNPADSKSSGKQNKSIAAIIAGVFVIGVGIWYFLRRRCCV